MDHKQWFMVNQMADDEKYVIVLKNVLIYQNGINQLALETNKVFQLGLL